jgi:hypothetical protein
MVTHTRLDPSAVVTMSFALDVQVGRDPGAPGAIRVGMTLSFYIDHAREELPLPSLLISCAYNGSAAEIMPAMLIRPLRVLASGLLCSGVGG